jgi:hypothetical protein
MYSAPFARFPFSHSFYDEGAGAVTMPSGLVVWLYAQFNEEGVKNPIFVRLTAIQWPYMKERRRQSMSALGGFGRFGTSVGIILVLFILLVIISRAIII